MDATRTVTFFAAPADSSDESMAEGGQTLTISAKPLSQWVSHKTAEIIGSSPALKSIAPH
jgi:hypothetical protein